MNCAILPLNLKLKREFVVTGGRESLKRNYLVVLDDIGLGEAAGSVHHGASPEEIERDLMRLRDATGRQAIPDMLASMKGDVSAPALCAFSSAWHDLMAKREKKSLHRRFDIPDPTGKATSVTVSVGDMDAWDEYLRNGFDCLKVKLSDDASWNLAAVEKMKADTRARYRVDANAGWDMDNALRHADELPVDRVELIEQPFPAEDIESWKRLRARTEIPLFMDESIAGKADVERVAGYVDGINIKIQKSGRLEDAAAAMGSAREHGLKVMLGCMIESSVGIATAFQLSGLADFLDLDGRLLIEGDPFTGLKYNGNIVTVAQGYGHGVSLA